MRYDIVTTLSCSKVLMSTLFCLEKTNVRKWYFNVLAMFSVGFWLESGKICKINDHTCLFPCINTCWVSREMFEDSA